MIQPKYGPIPNDRKDNEACCPVDEIQGHDFNRLEDYMSKPVLNVSKEPVYSFSQQGVRFSNVETSKSPLFLQQTPANKMTDILIKGASHMTGAIVKNLVAGTIQTIFPFLKRK